MPDREFTEIYADGVQVGAGAYGVTLTFYLSDPETPGSPGPIVGRVRLSRDLAKALRETIEASLARAPEGKIEEDHPG
jgi:hypothetical protein